ALSYGGDLLASITEPGSRVLTAAHTGQDLTGVADVDGTSRALAYDNAHRALADQWAPFDAAYHYAAGTGVLTGIDQGLGSVWQLTPVSTRALASAAALSPADLVGTALDPLGHLTVYDLDTKD